MHLEEITDQMERHMGLSQEQEKQKQEEERRQTQADGGEEEPSKDEPKPEDPREATRPDLPPSMAATQGKTADDILADLNKSPLFMTNLEENDDIAALQAINYEGSAYENAEGFKERGNECFKVKGYVDAREFYTKGIQVLAVEERKRHEGKATTNPEGIEDGPEEIAEQRSMLEALYVNRAACHLGLDNYRSCWLDCAAALRLNPRNVKACYRSARALLAVDRVEEADDVCARGLAVDEGNKPLRAVAAEIVSRAKDIDEMRRKKAEREAVKRRRAYLLAAALKARNIATRSTPQPPEMEDASVSLVPDPDDPRSRLAFPTVLLYPLALESDFIKSFEETHTLEDHLSYVLPLPWDERGAYASADRVVCYVETRDGGLLKMGKRMPLLKVLSTGKVEVVDQVVRVFVLPAGEADGWVDKFKRQKAVEMGKPK